MPKPAEVFNVGLLKISDDESFTAVIPSKETIRNGTYPLRNPALPYWDADTTNPMIEKFAAYCEQEGMKRP